MENETSREGSGLILGRSFFMIAKTKIDVHAGTLSMEFGDTYVKFNIFKAQKHPAEEHSIFSIDAIDGLMEEYFRLGTGHASLADFVNISNPLLRNLKYAYLGDNQQFSVIIVNHLNREQEEKLLEVLKRHKKAISWALADLLGINPSICMHKILLEEDARPVRQQQRRLNPTLLDIDKKEVTKLLVARIIYPISDSQWVSLVQVVPKKSKMTVVKNRQEEMEAESRNLQGPLSATVYRPSIHIALVDQHKTIFTCPFRTFAYTRMSFELCNASSTF
ncbi:hypothetical protein CR513_07606, partial [Mucuna pruriens]